MSDDRKVIPIRPVPTLTPENRAAKEAVLKMVEHQIKEAIRTRDRLRAELGLPPLKETE